MTIEEMQTIIATLTPEELQDPRVRAKLHEIRKTLDRLLERSSREQMLRVTTKES